jgi:thiamine phosphate synthase YjbQ (UPF0047 family)
MYLVLSAFTSSPISLNDELEEVQKEEFSAVFQKLYDRTKACIHTREDHF